MHYPYYEEISYQPHLEVFGVFSAEKGAILLDSAEEGEHCGRYSFIAVDPFLSLNYKNSDRNPFLELKKYLADYALSNHPALPPFQGGVAGFFSYDLCHYLEDIPRVTDDMQFPDMLIGFYDVVIAFDHWEKRAWIFSNGYPEKETPRREKRAIARVKALKNKLATYSELHSQNVSSSEIESNFTAIEYQQAVRRVTEYIRNGDIFEANISQRFKAHLGKQGSAFDLYQKLRKINPAPFSAFLNWGEVVIASASPERFLKLTDKKVETRPIKGTRPRGGTAVLDNQLAEELLQSEKDHAENVMIVDLLRNDLSRVCEPHSIQVLKLCGLESFATVHHLVSVVEGKLRKDCDAIDLLCATFPGGSITGAPKIRAMEIIAEIEPTARGPYCGSIGYIGFNGDLDLSITIRTFAVKDNCVTFQAGGAVTIDSDPRAEYAETLTKSSALRRALL